MTDYGAIIRGRSSLWEAAPVLADDLRFFDPTIIGFISGCGTTFRRDFDCTDQVLDLDLDVLRSLQDESAIARNLPPLWLIGEAQECFHQRYWKQEGCCSVSFDYLVEVVGAIQDFFGVEKLREITEEQLENARARRGLYGSGPSFS